MDRVDLQDHPEILGHPELLDQWDQMVKVDPVELLVVQDLQVRREIVDQQVHLDNRELLD